MLENEITGKFISDALQELEDSGWLEKSNIEGFNESGSDIRSNANTHNRRFFVRRLRHLQHICQTFEGRLSKSANVIGMTKSKCRVSSSNTVL